jgi:hypothetical protein
MFSKGSGTKRLWIVVIFCMIVFELFNFQLLMMRRGFLFNRKERNGTLRSAKSLGSLAPFAVCIPLF